MPLYVYRCGECGQEVDVVHGMKEIAQVLCPDCGGNMRKKPQKFIWGRSAWDVLYHELDEQYREKRGRKKHGAKK